MEVTLLCLKEEDEDMERTTEVIQFSTLQSAKFLCLDLSQFLYTHWMQNEKLFG